MPATDIATTVAPVGGERSTTEYLEAALAGDRQAWDAIVDKYANLVWWIARGYRLDDATAADVVQTVWLQLVQHGRSIRDPERLGAWLATTARREAERRYTASRRQVPIPELQDQPENRTVGPEEHALDSEITAAALAAFQQLGANCQRLLALMCQVPPQSYSDISASLGIPLGSIGPTRQRCLTTLRAELTSMGF